MTNKTEFQRVYEFLRRHWLDRNIADGNPTRVGFDKMLAEILSVQQSSISVMKKGGNSRLKAAQWQTLGNEFGISVGDIIAVAVGED